MKMNLYAKMQDWLVRLCVLGIRALGKTIRFHFDDPHHLRANIERRPYIYAFWHRYLLLMPVIYKLYAPSRKLSVLISRSRDGELITRVIECFGLSVTRGSTNRLGHVAMRQLVTKVNEEQCSIAFTPDGPRGPRGKIKPGILYLSQRESMPIIPIRLSYTWKITLNSWDHFIVPLPFSRCTIHVSNPIIVSPDQDLSLFTKSEEELTRALGPVD